MPTLRSGRLPRPKRLPRRPGRGAAESPPSPLPAPAAITPKPVIAPVSPEATRTGDAGLEWVEISSPVNVRSAPTPQSETIKIAVPGKRYQATGRQGAGCRSPTQATSEVGWVYARYVAASEAQPGARSPPRARRRVPAAPARPSSSCSLARRFPLLREGRASAAPRSFRALDRAPHRRRSAASFNEVT